MQVFLPKHTERKVKTASQDNLIAVQHTDPNSPKHSPKASGSSAENTPRVKQFLPIPIISLIKL